MPIATLPLLDKLLKRVLRDGVLLDGVPLLAIDGQISFVAPDASWRSSPLAAQRPLLSVYLADVRENVKLRSNERIERQEGTAIVARRAPYRMDCHYLISAWSSAALQPGPPWQHTLLYEATGALIHGQPLIPAKVYLPGSKELEEWPEDLQDIELPMTVNPPEGFLKLADFWGTLDKSPWQPVVYVVVTVPVERRDGTKVEMVRHQTTMYGLDSAAELFSEIGGTVIDRDGTPIGRAWVIAEDDHFEELARTTSDDEGRFVLRLTAKATQVRAAAFAMGTTPRISIPTTTVFNLRFS